ncbi:MAG: hypothetical protein IJA75_03640 [Oscillospiraceae bacterium]|nr:hypothetical protein [Oscillospiraceae bacterium]
MTLTKAAQSRVDRLKGQLQDGSLRRNGGTGEYSGAFAPAVDRSGSSASTGTVLSTSARKRIDVLKQGLSGGGLRSSAWDTRGTPEERDGAKKLTPSPADELLKDYRAGDGAWGWEAYLAEKSREQEREKPWGEKLLGYLGTGSPDASWTAEVFTKVVEEYRRDLSFQEPSEEWSDGERDIFGYLWGKDRSSAQKYAAAVNDAIAGGKREEQAKKVRAEATDGFWKSVGHSVAAIGGGALGLADYLDAVAEYSARGRISEKGALTPAAYAREVTGGVSEHLNDYGTINEDIPVIGGKGWGDVYGLGMSIAQSAVAAHTVGQIGTLVQFFGSAAASGIEEAKRRGADDRSAMQYGTLVGAAEGLAEMIGVDNLLKIGSSATMRELMINLVKQGTAEGLEEGITTLLNNFSDQLVMGDKSNFSLLVQHYMDKDLGEEEAKRQAWVDMAEDLAFDVLGGFVSGTVHAGPETAYKTAVQAQETQTPQQTTEEIRTPAYEELIAKKDIPVIEVGRNAGNKTYAELREDALNVADFNGWYDAPFVNKDTNIPVFLTRKSFTHSASGLTESFGEDTLLALQQTPKLIENAVLTNAAPPRDPSKGESRVLTMFAAIKGSNGIEPIKITVKQFDNKPGNNPPKNILEYFRRAKTSGGYNTLYDMRALEVVSIESAKKEFDASGSAAGSTVQPEAKTTSNSNIRVADLLDLVKGDAEKYIPQKRDVTQVSAEGQTTNHETNARSALASPSPADSVPQNTAKVNGHFNEKRAQGMDTREPSAAGEQTGFADIRGIEKDMDGNVRQPIPAKKVHFDRRGKKLNGVQETALTRMEQLSVLLDVEFEVFESYISAAGERVYRDENGVEQAAPNGWYDPATGKIHVDLNAGADGKGTMIFTVAHELTHFIRDWSPGKFDKLAEAVFELVYKEKNISVAELVRKQQEKAARNGMELSFEEAYEEMVADSMEGILTSGNVVELMAEVKQRDVTLWEKLREWFRSLAEDIKKLVRAYRGYKPDSREGRAVASMKEMLPVIEGFYADALMEASENRQGAEGQKNITREGGVRYSYAGKTADGIEVYETSEEVKKLTWKDRKKRFLQLMRDQYRGRTAKFIRNGHSYYAKFEYRDVSKNIYGDNKSDPKGRDAKINIGADGDIFELVENSQYARSEIERGKSQRMHRGVNHWDYFVKTVQIDGMVFDLTANVRKKADGEFVYIIEMMENNEIEPSSPQDSQNSGRNGVPNGSVISISNVNPDVKKKLSARDFGGSEPSDAKTEYFRVFEAQDDLYQQMLEEYIAQEGSEDYEQWLREVLAREG